MFAADKASAAARRHEGDSIPALDRATARLNESRATLDSLIMRRYIAAAALMSSAVAPTSGLAAAAYLSSWVTVGTVGPPANRRARHVHDRGSVCFGLRFWTDGDPANPVAGLFNADRPAGRWGLDSDGEAVEECELVSRLRLQD